MVKRKRASSFNGARKKVALAKTALRLGRIAYNKFLNKKQQSGGEDRMFLTSQQDTKNVYRSKRMSRAKKSKYKRTVQLIRRIKDFTTAQRVFLLQNMEKVTWQMNTSHYTGAIMGRFDPDKEEIGIREALDKWLPATGASSGNDSRLNNSKVMLDSAVLRVVLRNGNDPPAGASGTIDVDVYQVVCRQDAPDSVIAETYTIGDWLAIQQYKQRKSRGMDFPTFGSGTSNTTFGGELISATTQNNQSLGSTLFDNTQATKYFRIVKWTKVQLPVGGVTEFSFKMFKNKIINLSDVYAVSNDGAPGNLSFKSGITGGFIINVNGRLYEDGSSQLQNEAGTIFVERYVRYSFKPIEEIGGVTLDMQRTNE